MGAEETRENDAAHYGNNSIHCSSVKSGILNDAKAAPALARSADARAFLDAAWAVLYIGPSLRAFQNPPARRFVI